MIGAIVGDVIGSYYEFKDTKGRDLNLMQPASTFTDDSILSAAVAAAIAENPDNPPYKDQILRFTDLYIDGDSNGPSYITPSFGGMFVNWFFMDEDHDPYDSYGNGGSMRTTAVAWAYNDLDTVIEQAKAQSHVTHSHPEGMKGAAAVAATGFMFRQGASVDEVLAMLTERFEIDAALDLDQLHREYDFNETAQGTVPQAIACALYADSFEATMRNVLYIGGDSDTIGAIAGGIAEIRFGVPEKLIEFAESRLRLYGHEIMEAVELFESKYGCHRGELALENTQTVPEPEPEKEEERGWFRSFF